MFADYEYANTRRVTYGKDGATFVPVCEKCGRYVKADKEIMINLDGDVKGETATCSKCGRVNMPFEGFMGEEMSDES